MSSPYFSVIIPTFNRCNELSEALNSIVKQSFSDWECIVVDDGSTDNTENFVLNQSKFDSRIKYVYQKNAERSEARNNGILNSQGKYVCFLDSDDTYVETFLEDLYGFIKQNNEPIAMIEALVIRLENGRLYRVPFESVHNYKNPIQYLLMAKESVIPSRVCIHRVILEKNKFDKELQISEDTELFTRIVANYPFIQASFYGPVYHIHNNNTTNLKNNPFEGQLKSLKKIFDNNESRRFLSRKMINGKLSNCYFGIAKYWMIKRKNLKARFYLLRSIILKPNDSSTKNKIYLLVFPSKFS